MTRYFMDTEFIEDGKTIDLISIGIVCEDGRELYLQSAEFDGSRASEWVQENVIAHLEVCRHAMMAHAEINSFERDKAYHKLDGQCTFTDSVKYIAGLVADCPWRTHAQIKREILAFMDIKKYGEPVLYGYYSAYDHVAFAQIFGTMMDLPQGFPMYTRDIKQMCDARGNPKLPEQHEGEHNALWDARWNKQAYEFLLNYEGEPENILYDSHDY